MKVSFILFSILVCFTSVAEALERESSELERIFNMVLDDSLEEPVHRCSDPNPADPSEPLRVSLRLALLHHLQIIA